MAPQDEIVYHYVKGQGWVAGYDEKFVGLGSDAFERLIRRMEEIYESSFYDYAARVLCGNTMVRYPRSISYMDDI